MKTVKVTVEDLHELEWSEGTVLEDLPKAKVTFIGEVAFENDEYMVLRFSRFHPNEFNLPLKNVGVYLPKSMILDVVELKETEECQE